MGKSKKTRWRSFSFNGSREETLVSGAADNTKLNGTNDSHSANQKYSQILGDHQTNNFTTQLSNKSTSTTSSQNHTFKARSYNNKENYYNNQRNALRNGPKNGWHRSNSSINSYRGTTFSSKDNKRTDENGKPGSNNVGDEAREPIKFNEDEYTRITTPRQDVLFKKGYLSRMNSKTANSTLTTSAMAAASTSCTSNGVDSTAPNSTATNSDPDSANSVSTLSPATTPSMDYAQQDSMEYAQPMFYSGYYDESGTFVIPQLMFNNYPSNYSYFSSNGSATNSPVIFLPCPYPYDPFFMAPNTEVPISTETDQTTNDGDDQDRNENEKAEIDGAKEIDQQTDEQENSESKDVKHEQQEANEENTTATNEIDGGDQSMKANFPVYANELGYVYPAYANGFVNGFYYGMPVNRPPKIKRRKRFPSSRSSTSHPPRSAETTTDYSDDENGSHHHAPHHHKRNHYSSSRHHHNNHHNHNGWTYPHHNGYNQYHYYSKYSYNNNKYHYQSSVEQNTTQVSETSESTPQQLPESNLNVDVQEFYPRVQQQVNETKSSSNNNQSKSQTESKCDVPSKVSDHETKASKNGNKTSQQHQPQIQQSLPPPLPVRATKKEIMEGTKSMEQQNINLNQCKSLPTATLQQDVEWNVIKKGKKVKVVKDQVNEENETPLKKDLTLEIVPVKVQEVTNEVVTKKSTTLSPVVPSTKATASKKSKGKGKKKKSPHSMAKQQDGFEIIEPQFGNVAKSSSSDEVNAGSGEEDDTLIEDDQPTEITIASENNVENMELLNVNDEEKEKDAIEEVKSQTEVILEKLSNLEDDSNAIIDISDEEICCKTPMELDLVEIAQEIINNEEKVVEICEEVTSIAVAEQQSEVTKDLKNDEPELKLHNENVEKSPQELPIELENTDSCPSGPLTPTFDDINFFGDNKNIAELERDLIENLRNMDDGIDIKSPLINPLYDFPITTAVGKWLQEKQNESFDNLFHVQNFKKLSELYDEYDGESDISESPNKSETTDSDYGSDCQHKFALARESFLALQNFHWTHNKSNICNASSL